MDVVRDSDSFGLPGGKMPDLSEEVKKLCLKDYIVVKYIFSVKKKKKKQTAMPKAYLTQEVPN